MIFKLNNKQKSKFRLSSESGAGFTMIELVAAIAVLAVGILGLYSAFYSLSNIAYTYPSRLSADYLSQEGLEIARNIRDTNVIANISWSAGLINCSAGCQTDYKTGTAVETTANQLGPYNDVFLNLNADGLYSYDAGTASLFKRKITVTQPSGPDALRVDVQITWNYKGQPFSIQNTEYLYNY